MQTVYDKDFKIIVDFAHTPNSFEKLLSQLKPDAAKRKGRLIHVFGAAGLRDAFKRPQMGNLSATFSDVIIITEEDYRTEDPIAIAAEIEEGIMKHDFHNVHADDLSNRSRGVFSVMVDRQKAIDKAVSIAKKGDIIVTTGKSHEKSLCRGATEYPWDEFEAVKGALSSRAS
jgi:UDP-N-acetylmuramoyl-L-alanyl-D-glutamate--2,6-diaminopimelate ligase